MIQFLQPIWLWAITGIAVPLVIHLWNIKEGKTVKVGSIMFVQEAARSQAKSLKLSELLLLLLRCLLIICCALLLAQPVLNRTAAAKNAGWVLLPAAAKQEVYQHFKTAIDSLVKAGYELHLLEKDFPATTPNAGDTSARADGNYWGLIAGLNSQLPAASPVEIFTDGQQRHFMGDRPATALSIRWHTWSPGDSTVTSLLAFATPDDSTREVKMHSTADGTWFTLVNGSAGGNADTNGIRIALYAGKNNADAGYLLAALEALKEFTSRKIIITRLSDPILPAGNTDWLFWLSEQPTPEGHNGNIFRYAGSKALPISAQVHTGEGVGFRTFKLRENNNELIPVWGDGKSIVLGRNSKAPKQLEFNSRFLPQWTDLVWQGGFPKLIASLVLKQNGDFNMQLLNRIDPQQVQVRKLTAGELLPSTTASTSSIPQTWLWLLAFALLAVERWLSFRSKQRG